MHYVMSDIHGCYNEFLKMLDFIEFKEEDTLYILGDIFDRGPEPIKIYEYIKDKKNIKMSMGNHELFMLNYFDSQYKPNSTRECIETEEIWFANGGRVTLKQISELPKENIDKLYAFVKNLPYYFIVDIENIKYLLVHAGFYPLQEDSLYELMKEQDNWDLVWIRDSFFTSELKYDFKTIFGHTPVKNVYKRLKNYDYMLKNLKQPTLLEEYEEDKYIIFNNKIGIDGACVFGGNLSCIRLEDEAMFFVPSELK